MIKISAIFLISFFAMSTCLEVSTEFSVPFVDNKDQLVDMLVQVKTEGDVNTIAGFIGQLRQMLDTLVSTQEKHRQIHAKMMKQCKDEEHFRTVEIQTAKIALGRATRALNRCQVSLKHAEKELPSLVHTKHSYERELARAQKARDVERKKYLARRREYREAEAFLRRFIAVVNTGLKEYQSVGFLELSEGLLKHSNILNVMEASAPVLVTLASEHHYKFTTNSQLRNKLVALLNDLLSRIQRDNKRNNEIERSSVAAFTKYKARLTKVINTLSRNIARVEKQIKEMKNCVAVEGGVIATALKKLDRNSKLLAQARNMCNNFNKEFIDATVNRLNEIGTMAHIIRIVNHRFKELPRDLVKYLEEVKNGWKRYVNSTEFQKFKEYERKKWAQNHRGALLAKMEAAKDKNPVDAVVRGAHGID